MKIKNSEIFKKINKTVVLKTGVYYILNNIIISEIHEGAHIDLKTSQEFFDFVNSHFKNETFYFISNRINQFSVSPLDIAKYTDILPNLKSICAITYNNRLDSMNAEIEKHFHSIPYQITNNIDNALSWTHSLISRKSIV